MEESKVKGIGVSAAMQQQRNNQGSSLEIRKLIAANNQQAKYLGGKPAGIDNKNYAETPYESRKHLNLSRSSLEGTPSDPYMGFYDEYLSPNTRSALKLVQPSSHFIAPTPMELTSKVNTAQGAGLDAAQTTMYIDENGFKQ